MRHQQRVWSPAQSGSSMWSVAYQLGDSSRGVVCLLIWYSRRASEFAPARSPISLHICRQFRKKWSRVRQLLYLVYITLQFKANNAYHFSHFTVIYGKEAKNGWVLSLVLNDRRHFDDVILTADCSKLPSSCHSDGERSVAHHREPNHK